MSSAFLSDKVSVSRVCLPQVPGSVATVSSLTLRTLKIRRLQMTLRVSVANTIQMLPGYSLVFAKAVKAVLMDMSAQN